MFIVDCFLVQLRQDPNNQEAKTNFESIPALKEHIIDAGQFVKENRLTEAIDYYSRVVMVSGSHISIRIFTLKMLSGICVKYSTGLVLVK